MQVRGGLPASGEVRGGVTCDSAGLPLREDSPWVLRVLVVHGGDRACFAGGSKHDARDGPVRTEAEQVAGTWLCSPRWYLAVESVHTDKIPRHQRGRPSPWTGVGSGTEHRACRGEPHRSPRRAAALPGAS